MKAILAVVLGCAVAVCAEDAASRHNEGGSVGGNGVTQLVAIKMNKLVLGKDSATIQVDLGEHRYSSSKPEELIKHRPVILLTIGSVPTMTALANAKGQIIGEKFKAKLVANGAGMKITLKKQDLSALLSSLSGKGDHAFLTLTIQDNHAPSGSEAAAQSAGSRHASALFSKEFQVDIKENAKALTAKGG